MRPHPALFFQHLEGQPGGMIDIPCRRRAIGKEDVGADDIDQATGGYLTEIGDLTKIEQDPATGNKRRGLYGIRPVLQMGRSDLA